MVYTYYLSYLPYNLAWRLHKLLHPHKLHLVHIEDSFDYFLFAKVSKHLKPMDAVVSSNDLIPKLLQMPNPPHKIYQYPWCFPDSVIMFRNAAWKYPVKRIVKIGLEHGAYNFKRFPKAYYYNLFDLYLMTSFADVKRLKALGAKPVKAIGYPKSDPLFDGSYSPELLDKLKDELKLDPAKPTVLFSSTWDGSGMSAIHKWFNQLHIIKSSYNILVTLHPRMSQHYKSYLQKQPGIHFIEAMDIYPYLLLADVCIGDTNSLIAEFCIVNRPIITFSIKATKRTLDDVIELIKGISNRIDYFSELPAAISQALETAEQTSDNRKQVISTLIDPLDGKAGWRAAQEIIKLIPELKP